MSKPSENIINTPPKYPQTHLETFFFGSFFTPNRPKTAKSPTLPLQAHRHLMASSRVIKDTNWGVGGPKCVNTIGKHHKYPPKVSPNTFGNFFFRVIFYPKSPLIKNRSAELASFGPEWTPLFSGDFSHSKYA